MVIIWEELTIRQDPDARKDWRQQEKGMTEDEMVGWYHWLDGRDFEQAPGDSEGQGNLTCNYHGITKRQTWLRDWTTAAATLGLSVCTMAVVCPQKERLSQRSPSGPWKTTQGHLSSGGPRPVCTQSWLWNARQRFQMGTSMWPYKPLSHGEHAGR